MMVSSIFFTLAFFTFLMITGSCSEGKRVARGKEVEREVERGRERDWGLVYGGESNSSHHHHPPSLTCFQMFSRRLRWWRN